MMIRAILLSICVTFLSASSTADDRIHNTDKDSLIRIHKEFSAIEQLLVDLEKKNRSTASPDPSSGGVIFNYGVLLSEVRKQLAGIESHIQLLNSSPQWQRFTLE